MKKRIFLSYARPFMRKQEIFLRKIAAYLSMRGYEPCILKIEDYDDISPLLSVKELLETCDGILVIAFRRTIIDNGINRPQSDIGQESALIKNEWLTSAWCYIETSMAFQMELPILFLSEHGVMNRDVFGDGDDLFMAEFCLDDEMDVFFQSEKWSQKEVEWEKKLMLRNKSK